MRTLIGALLAAASLVPAAAPAAAQRFEGRRDRAPDAGEAPDSRPEQGWRRRDQPRPAPAQDAQPQRPDRGPGRFDGRGEADGPGRGGAGRGDGGQGGWRGEGRGPDRGPDRPNFQPPAGQPGRPDPSAGRTPEDLRADRYADAWRRDAQRRELQRRDVYRDRADQVDRRDWARSRFGNDARQGAWGRSDWGQNNWGRNDWGQGNWGRDDDGRGTWSGRSGGNWDRGWRSDRRYDFDRYRSQNRDAYRLPRYYAPQGWNRGYSRFGIGLSLSPLLWGQNYWIADPWAYRLPEAYGPYRWVRYYDDALLVDLRSGLVVDAVYGIFW